MVFFGKMLLQSCIFHQNILPKLASTIKVWLGKVRLTLLWWVSVRLGLVSVLFFCEVKIWCKVYL